MQTIRRRWANASQRVHDGSDRIGPRASVRQRAAELFVLSGCLVLALLAAVRPAAAEGVCKGDDPSLTHIRLLTNSGYDMRFTLRLEGDKITGKLFVNPA